LQLNGLKRIGVKGKKNVFGHDEGDSRFFMNSATEGCAIFAFKIVEFARNKMGTMRFEKQPLLK
jgi:hypothetical protein